MGRCWRFCPNLDSKLVKTIGIRTPDSGTPQNYCVKLRRIRTPGLRKVVLLNVKEMKNPGIRTIFQYRIKRIRDSGLRDSAKLLCKTKRIRDSAKLLCKTKRIRESAIRDSAKLLCKALRGRLLRSGSKFLSSVARASHDIPQRF